MVSPPDYDHGAMRWVSRGAGFAAMAGIGIGLATSFGLISGGTIATIAGVGLTISGIGEALAVGAGVYFTADFIAHHTHQIAHAFDDAPAVPVPELGLILTARTQPDPVVICQVEGQDASFEPRFFGLGQEGTGLRVLVCEILTREPSGPGRRADFGTMISYTLVTPLRAAQVICAWARALSKRDGFALPVADVFGHLENGQPCHDRIELRAEGRSGEMLAQQMLLDALTRNKQ